MKPQIEYSKQIPLPESAQAIAEIIGREAALLLASKASHRAIYVPKEIKPHHWIERTLGHDLTRRLHSEFRGMHVTIAKCSEVRRQRRNEAILKAHKRGESIRAIAAQFGLTYHRVRQIVMLNDTKNGKPPCARRWPIGSSGGGGERVSGPAQKSPSASAKNHH